ncbi:MAG: hypothetical protein MRJ92_02345 [Nitrospira sp.]|nr:hypothetical protein [Nitrospira sp.]
MTGPVQCFLGSESLYKGQRPLHTGLDLGLQPYQMFGVNAVYRMNKNVTLDSS